MVFVYRIIIYFRYKNHTVLYREIRYAEEIRKLYRIRHSIAKPGHKEIGSLLDFPKYSKQFYRIKGALKDDQILSRMGAFIENAPNLWVVRLPLRASREQTKALGHRIPYMVFLAACLTRETTSARLAMEFFVDKHSVFAAANRLRDVGVLRKTRRSKTPDQGLRKWLLKYISLAKDHADTTGDLSYLLGAVPAYVSGPAAHLATTYVPGAPVGPRDMVIATYAPYRRFWGSLIRDGDYFKEYPKRVEIRLANPADDQPRIAGVP